MHLAYRWFSRLGFEREIPDHSTFSKNRHGRFRQSGVFRKVFEEIVRRCLEAGLVEGRSLAVDGTLVGANASEQSRVPREQLARTARVSRTVQEYLTELEQQNPVADPDEHPMVQQMVSTTDPDAVLAVKRGPATLGLLRQLPGGHDQSGDFVGRCHACTFPPRSTGRTTNDRAREPVRHSSTESGGRQGLRKRRVSGVAPKRGIFNRTSRSSIVSTKHEDASPEMRSAMNPRKMPTTVRKGNRCTIEVSGAVARAISIARHQRNAKAVHKRSYVLQVPIGDCLFIGRSQRDKRSAR